MKQWKYLLIPLVIVLLIILFRKPIISVMAKGYKNNNPGNIRLTFDAAGNKIILYQGEIDGSSKSFRAFESMAYGYRAMFSLLTHYVNTEGLNTIRKIVSTYAPPEDNNDTEAYIKNVSDLTNVAPDDIVDITDTEFFQQMVAAMSLQENGIDADMNEVNEGLNLLYA
jgi:hypothetical protein